MDVKGKVVLVTGASAGIGAELSRQLSAKGARLALVARRADKLAQLARELGDTNKEVLPLTADVGDRAQLAAAIEQAVARFGGLDLVVNNAGSGWFGPVATMPLDEFDRVVRTNVYGLFHAVQLAVPHLKASRGMIVNVSSGLSKRALPFLTAYAGTKSMMDAMSDGLRLELKKHGIRVLNYCPPETDTEFVHAGPRDSSLNLSGMRPRKLAPVRKVAGNILAAIEGDKREVVEGRFLQIANFFAPRFLDSIFYKAMVLKLSRD